MGACWHELVREPLVANLTSDRWADPSCRWMTRLMGRRCWCLLTSVEGWKIRYLEMGIAKSMACIWAAAKERTSTGIMVGPLVPVCRRREKRLLIVFILLLCAYRFSALHILLIIMFDLTFAATFYMEDRMLMCMKCIH
jgi:hypothetical protein